MTPWEETANALARELAARGFPVDARAFNSAQIARIAPVSKSTEKTPKKMGRPTKPTKCPRCGKEHPSARASRACPCPRLKVGRKLGSVDKKKRKRRAKKAQL